MVKTSLINLCEVLSAFVGAFPKGDLLLPWQQVFTNKRTCVCAMCYLFQCSLYLDSLSPGYSGISQAVTIVGPPGEINALFVQVAEGLRHHLHGIVGQC